MQHLEDEYGIRDPAIPYVVGQNVEPPKTFGAFMEFPRSLGWRVDPLNHTLDVDKAYGRSPEPLQSFLQAWLFFGLIYTVVQDNGEPLLAKSELLESDNHDYITTRLLPIRLSDWMKACIEAERKNTHESRLRTIRVDNVLDLARRVVRANLVHETRADTYIYDDLYIPDEVVLSIMVLGETLCSAKNSIMDETGMRMSGWYDEDERGWGPPIYVLNAMRKELWCPRAVYLLRTQLRSNATLLVAASRNKSPSTTGERHYDPDPAKQCTEKVCYVTPEDTQGRYNQCHCEDFCGGGNLKGGCEGLYGPDNNAVRNLLKQDRRPLLRFTNVLGDNLGLEVMDWNENKVEYATISHVWSDGFGNPHRNELRPCQLRFIRYHLMKLQNGEQPAADSTSPSIPFWMDTLIIPVGQDDEAEVESLKKRGIKQITGIFLDSAHTIVVDLGLLGMGTEGPPTQTAMKILASNWMRRLWTLQEAYLSRSIHVAFKHPRRGPQHLETLFKDLTTKNGQLTPDLVKMVHNQLQHNLMHSERQERRAHTDSAAGTKALATRKSVLVANAWKAARWRTTSNEFHETLALATLLELDFDTGSDIAQAGLAKNIQWREKSDEEKDRHRDKLMKQFWTIFHRTYGDAIPPGIVFLPPPRLQVEGYGWAPRTWMSAHELDFPDPLRFTGPEFTSHLVPKGLRVCFPGFLLHTGDRRKVLLTDQNDKKFHFPVDQKLHEWYVVERIDDAGEPKWFLNSVLNMTDQLAIILSRPRPRDSQAEIGLLVQISAKSKEEQAFECSIIRRVKVSRSTAASTSFLGQEDAFRRHASESESSLPTTTESRIMVSSERDDDICIGEILESNQNWVVDGFSLTWDRRQQRPRSQETPRPYVDKNHKRLLFHRHEKSGSPLNSTKTKEPVPPSSQGPVRGGTIDVASTQPTASFQAPTSANLLRRRTTLALNKLGDKWQDVKQRIRTRW